MLTWEKPEIMEIDVQETAGGVHDSTFECRMNHPSVS